MVAGLHLYLQASERGNNKVEYQNISIKNIIEMASKLMRFIENDRFQLSNEDKLYLHNQRMILVPTWELRVSKSREGKHK